MEKRRLVAIISGMLAVAWAGVLFFFSGQSGVDSSSLSLEAARMIVRWFPGLNMGPADLEPILRKIAHFGIFAAEGFLTGLSLINILGYVKGMVLSFSVCALMAIANELHQLLSPERSCEIRDMIIDSGGALTGVIFAAAVIVVINCFTKQKTRYDSQAIR